MTRRLIVTGAPGCGKTTTLDVLRRRRPDVEVVAEAATDVNLELLAAGVARPEDAPDFLDRIVARQRARRLSATGARQVHDRSVFCTLALARYLALPVPDTLHREVAAVAGRYEPVVAFLAPLGFVTPTPVRRIPYDEALAFGELHRAVYREHGFTLLGVPVDTAERRADLLDGVLGGAGRTVSGMVDIRPARAEDVAVVADLAARAYAPYTPRVGRPVPPATADYASLIAAGDTWIATAGDAAGDDVLGYVVLVDHDDHLLLQNVAVDPDAQGGGVGRALLEHAEDEARRRGRPEVRLYTNEAMTENLAYYPRRGYVETGRDVASGFRRVFFRKTVGP